MGKNYGSAKTSYNSHRNAIILSYVILRLLLVKYQNNGVRVADVVQNSGGFGIKGARENQERKS
jgi:hypothetical protein